MGTTIEISQDVFELLRQRAIAANATPEQLAETAIRLQLGNTAHIELRQTAHGLQAYVRGTRVAVRHIAAFLQAEHTIEEIISIGLPQLAPAAIFEAIAYYHDHRPEIEAELARESREEITGLMHQRLLPEQLAQLVGQTD